MGTNHNNTLKLAADYIKFLGTSDLSPADFQQELYKLGCSVSVNSSAEKVTITLSGLASNFDASVELFETLLSSSVADEEALINLKLANLKQRADDKLNKQTILWSAMMSYAKFGTNSSFLNKLSEEELNNVTSDELIDIIHNITSYNHRILYYGPEQIDALSEKLSVLHAKK